jgi:hypothetical protein
VTADARATRALPGWALAIGDLTAFVLFAVIGLLDHDEGVTWDGIVRNVIPIALVWFAFARYIGTYRDRSIATMIRTWAIAIPGGVLVRAVALKRDAVGSQIAFAMVAALTTLALLLVWRGIASVIAQRWGKPGKQVSRDADRDRFSERPL